VKKKPEALPDGGNTGGWLERRGKRQMDQGGNGGGAPGGAPGYASPGQRRETRSQGTETGPRLLTQQGRRSRLASSLDRLASGQRAPTAWRRRSCGYRLRNPASGNVATDGAVFDQGDRSGRLPLRFAGASDGWRSALPASNRIDFCGLSRLLIAGLRDRCSIRFIPPGAQRISMTMRPLVLVSRRTNLG